MKSVLLIGLGRFGQHIAQKLNLFSHEVLAVDSSEERVNAVLPYVTNAQIGDSTDPTFLASIGVESFDTCIVAIGDDFQSSLETTLTLKELGAKHVVARASTDIQEKFLLRNGADEVVYPEKQAAAWTAIRCGSAHVLEYMEVDAEYSIMEVEIPEAWLGKTVEQLQVRRKHGITILGARENGRLDLNITAETLLDDERSLLVCGSNQALRKCFDL